MDKLNEESEKMKALAGIQEGAKKFLTNESFSEKPEEPETKDIDFTVIKFKTEEVEPGPDDETLYKLQ